MRGPSLVLSFTLSSGILLAASSIPAAAAPPSYGLSDARAHAAQSVLVKVNGYRRYRRGAVAYAGPVAPYYAPRAYAPPYYNQPRAYYPTAPVYYAPPSAHYAAPPVYYAPPVQVYIIAPPSYPSPSYVPPAYYEAPAPAYYGYYSGNGYYDRGYYGRGYHGRYDGGYAVRW